LDIQVITVEQYQFFANEIEMAFGHAPEYATTDYIHNTKFFTMAARNNIFSTCDQIRDSLIRQWNMQKQHSNWPFERVLVMKLQYRTNKSTQKTERSRKHKGGLYINHFDVPMFYKYH